MELKDYLTIFASGLALIFSGYSIYRTSKNARRQILVGRLEEAYEIISELGYYYNAFLLLQLCLEDSISTKHFNAEQQHQNRIAYEMQVIKYKEHFKVEDLNHKCNRLEVIANAYLQKPLKIKVLAYSKFFWDLISISMNGQWITKETFYKKGFPDVMALNDVMENLLADLIAIIQLGGKSIKQKDVRKYIENTLKHELGI
ncbi:MAG: hypothetical protein V4561_02220 [Bacteroidota bacterium]